MFPEPSRPRTPQTLVAVVAAVALLAIGLWFGGHRSWLPGFLRSAFTSQSKNEKLENQVYGLLTKDYYRPLSRTALVNEGLMGAVASLRDPYSHYYDPSAYHAFTDATTNPQDDGGIGVGIGPFTGDDLVISEVYQGSPAARAGLKPGDVIVGAGGVQFAGHPENFMVARIRGKVGTSVALVIHHAHAARTVRVARANTSISVVMGRLIVYHGVKLGYVYLQMFSQGAGAEVRRQVDKLRARGARAILLDLRDDGGGLLQEAVNTASIFIPSGTIVSTDGRAQPRQVYMAEGSPIPTSIPMVVLVNQNTASSAEILTAALKQQRRATVVGTHTYGKGVFQEIMPLRNGGALDFTVGHFYTPDGQNLGGAKGVARGPGVLPDVYAGVGRDPDRVDRQLQVAERTLAAKVR